MSAASGMHLREVKVHRTRGSGQGAATVPWQFANNEVEARYAAALQVPFPEDVALAKTPATWGISVETAKALSVHPGAVHLALIQMVGFEMPRVVAA